MHSVWIVVGLTVTFLLARFFLQAFRLDKIASYPIILSIAAILIILDVLDHTAVIGFFDAPVDIAVFWTQVGLTLVFNVVAITIAVIVNRIAKFKSSDMNNPYLRFLKANPLQFSVLVFAYLPVLSFFEELIFRVLLIGLGLDGSHSWGISVLLILTSSFAFGLAHLSRERPGHAIQAGLAGIVWGTAFTITGSIWVPAAAHAIQNMFAFSMLYILMRRDRRAE